MAQVIRVCMLNADTPVPAVVVERTPTYGGIFHHLLSSAASNIAKSSEFPKGPITVASTDFNVVKNEYPLSLAEFDAIVISGSAKSAYDDLPWIHKLGRWLKHTYDHEPRVKIFGSCFGHQIVCQTLLKDYGVKVEKDAKGWELGVKEITLHQGFRRRFWNGKDEGRGQGVGEKLRLQFVHHDHVVIPEMEALPRSWTLVGNTQHCAVQGMYEPGRVLTLQGHFEFDRFVNRETIKFFFPNWQPKVLEEALDAIDADDDSIQAAEMVVRFFLEDSGQKYSAMHKGVRHALSSRE